MKFILKRHFIEMLLQKSNFAKSQNKLQQAMVEKNVKTSLLSDCNFILITIIALRLLLHAISFNLHYFINYFT